LAAISAPNAFGFDSAENDQKSFWTVPVSDLGVQYLYSGTISFTRLSGIFLSPENNSFFGDGVRFRGGVERFSLAAPMNPDVLEKYGVTWTSVAYYLFLNSIHAIELSLGAEQAAQIITYIAFDVPALLSNPEFIYGNSTFSLVCGWNIDTYIFKKSSIDIFPFVGLRVVGTENAPAALEFRIGYDYLLNLENEKQQYRNGISLSCRVSYFDFTNYKK